MPWHLVPGARNQSTRGASRATNFSHDHRMCQGAVRLFAIARGSYG